MTKPPIRPGERRQIDEAHVLPTKQVIAPMPKVSPPKTTTEKKKS